MTTTCYRHADRLTGASCTRCGRPICPECMIQAPVGHHCPACVGEANKGARQVRWTPPGSVGGRVTPVVATLIAINVVAYIVSLSRPSLVTRYEQAGVLVASGQYERLLTAAFLHAGILHLLFNMAALLIIGPPLEATLGRVRFLDLYVLAALGGSALSYLFSSPLIPSVGASGAIFGLFGAYFVIARSRRADTGGIVALIVINLVFSFAEPLIDWRAHVGGLVMGTAIASAFAFAETRPPGQRRLIEGAAGVAAALVVVGLVQVRTGQIRVLA